MDRTTEIGRFSKSSFSIFSNFWQSVPVPLQAGCERRGVDQKVKIERFSKSSFSIFSNVLQLAPVPLKTGGGMWIRRSKEEDSPHDLSQFLWIFGNRRLYLFGLKVGRGSDDRNRKILKIFVLHFSEFLKIDDGTSSDLRWSMDRTAKIGRFSRSSFSISLDFLK
ncbi:hypothetical protein SDJN03_07003, partial [Cucurbita argyrosperma subsp. sororia]